MEILIVFGFVEFRIKRKGKENKVGRVEGNTDIQEGGEEILTFRSGRTGL